jgi:hypothetical protein
MENAKISISVTEGRSRLIIDGPLDLFQKFITTLGEPNRQSKLCPETINRITEPAIETKCEGKPSASN